MSAAHTPGPWFAGAMSESGWIDVYTMEGDGFRSLPFASCKHFDQEANARLIAAAPELLEALFNLVGDIDPESENRLFDAARAAIAKAGGAQ